MKKLMLTLAILAMASLAGASTFTADGTVFEPTYDYNFVGNRIGLVNDGSFEAGSCVNTPVWICTADNGCDWITDLVPLGLWNYDGIHVAWLGGFCGGLATCSSTICQDVVIDGAQLQFQWMAYVNDAVMRMAITVDGGQVFEFFPQLSDHLLDYQPALADVSAYNNGGVHTLCFVCDNAANCSANNGDNVFVDYAELLGGTATEIATMSTVKALY